MISGKKPHGYTIIEVMIVLLITGVLLTTVGGTLRGRQQQSQFTAGVREFEANLNTEINEVASGQYPGNTTWTCKLSGSGELEWQFISSDQGTNTACMFIGKVLHPYVDGSYDIYNIAALRKNGDNEVTDLAGAKPSIVARKDASETGIPESRETSKLPYGLVIKQLKLTPETGGVINVPAIAFVVTLGNYAAGSQADLVSSSQSVDVIPVCNSGLTGSGQSCSTSDNLDTSATNITNISEGVKNNLKNTLRKPKQIVICLAKSQSDTNSSAAIILGKNNSKLSTEVTFNPSGAGC